jgi:hypothetical protein
LIDDIESSPFGSAVNRKEEIEMANNSVIRHDERNAETLFALEAKLCMLY